MSAVGSTSTAAAAAVVSLPPTVFDDVVAEERSMDGLSDTRDRVALVHLAIDAARERAHGFRLLTIGCDGYLRDQRRREAAALAHGAARAEAAAASEPPQPSEPSEPSEPLDASDASDASDALTRA